jgi:hypothetical protein
MCFGYIFKGIFMHLKFYHVHNVFNHKLKWSFLFLSSYFKFVCIFNFFFLHHTFNHIQSVVFFFWMSSKKRRKNQAMMFEFWKPNLATYHCYWLSTFESFYLCGHIVYLYGHNMHTIYWDCEFGPVATILRQYIFFVNSYF